jgi:myo-inositol catabolism protein IolH
MNSEFNGRPEKQPESEAQFWKSLEELMPIFEREGIQLRSSGRSNGSSSTES